MGKDDINLRTVKCNSCNNKMEIDKNSRGGNCWECVASGRAFMLPDVLEVAPSNNVLLNDDEYHKNLKIKKKEISKSGGGGGGGEEETDDEEVKEKPLRLGQTSLINKLLDKGLSVEEVIKKVAESIPQYPADRIPKLIKVVMFNRKRRAAKNV